MLSKDLWGSGVGASVCLLVCMVWGCPGGSGSQPGAPTGTGACTQAPRGSGDGTCDHEHTEATCRGTFFEGIECPRVGHAYLCEVSNVAYQSIDACRLACTDPERCREGAPSYFDVVVPAPSGGPSCNDSCQWAFDGECDDGRGAGVTACQPGTDCGDCGPLPSEAPPPEPELLGSGVEPACGDTCRYALDGECDDGSYGGMVYCDSGTDCSDCAAAPTTVPPAGSAGVPQPSCDDSCRYARDGECDDGSYGGTVYCDPGTDCSDCSGQPTGSGPSTMPQPADSTAPFDGTWQATIHQFSCPNVGEPFGGQQFTFTVSGGQFQLDSGFAYLAGSVDASGSASFPNAEPQTGLRASATFSTSGTVQGTIPRQCFFNGQWTADVQAQWSGSRQ